MVKNYTKFLIVLTGLFFNTVFTTVEAQHTRISTLQLNLDVLAPVGTYKNFTKASFIGGTLGYMGSTRNPNLYAGGMVTYGISDFFETFYDDFTVGGFITQYRERLYNSHLSFAFQGRFMPGWFTSFQPYAEVQTGVRRLGTFLVLTDIASDVDAGTTNYQSSWAMQYGASAGVLIPLNHFLMLDVGVSYLESQAMTHLLRQNDWREINPTFTTDIFEERRTAVKMMGLRIGLVLIL